MNSQSQLRIAAALFFALALCGTALAEDRTQVGRDIAVGPNEEVSDVTCFGCSVRIRGHVDGDVTAFGGRIVVEDQAEITGDATAFLGGIRLDKAVSVEGDVTVIGGRIRRDPGAAVGGEIAAFAGPMWIFLIIGLPFVLLSALIALIVWLVRRLTRRSIPATA